MRRVIGWCVRGFPFDPRSRRSLDETLADWAHEENQAMSRGQRWFATLRGALSVARVVSISIVRETADFSWCRGLAQRCGLLAGLVTLTALAQASLMLPALGAAVVPMALTMAPLMLLALAPPAMLLILGWRPVGRAIPTAGAACFLALAMLVLAGWLVPLSSDLANDLLRQSMLEAQRDFPAPEVSLAPSTVVLHVTSWGWLVAATVTFAAKLAKWSPLRSRWWLAGVPAIYATLIASLHFVIGTSFLVFRTSEAEAESTPQALALWIAAALIMTVAAAYRRGSVQTPNVPACPGD
jgi:hypothetical protein